MWEIPDTEQAINTLRQAAVSVEPIGEMFAKYAAIARAYATQLEKGDLTVEQFISASRDDAQVKMMGSILYDGCEDNRQLTEALKELGVSAQRESDPVTMRASFELQRFQKAHGIRRGREDTSNEWGR